MRKTYRLLLTTIILILSILLIGCQKKETKTLSPKSMLEESSKKLASSDSIDANITTEFSMSSNSDTFDINMNSQIVAFANPYKAKFDMNINMGALGSQKIETYLLNDNNQYNLYTNTNGSWTKTELSQDAFDQKKNDSLKQLSLDLYKNNADNFKKVGEEKLSNKKTVKLQGKITGDTIKNLLNTTTQLGVLDSNIPNIDSTIFKNLDDIPLTIWIDTDKMLPVKMSMDMTKIIQDIVDQYINTSSKTGTSNNLSKASTGQSSSSNVKNENSNDANSDSISNQWSSTNINIPKCIITIEYNKIGSVSDFSVPDELKNLN